MKHSEGLEKVERKEWKEGGKKNKNEDKEKVLRTLREDEDVC